MLIDSAQRPVAKYLYDPYGNTIAKSGALAEANTHRFSSKRFDDKTGLYHFGRRFYDPNLQRWLNRDPIGFKGGKNVYRYVRNRPTSFVDAWGLEELDPFSDKALCLDLFKRQAKLTDDIEKLRHDITVPDNIRLVLMNLYREQMAEMTELYYRYKCDRFDGGDDNGGGDEDPVVVLPPKVPEPILSPLTQIPQPLPVFQNIPYQIPFRNTMVLPGEPTRSDPAGVALVVATVLIPAMIIPAFSVLTPVVGTGPTFVVSWQGTIQGLAPQLAPVAAVAPSLMSDPKRRK